MSQILVAGQIGDPTVALPAGAGAKLWYLNPDSYGQQVASTGGLDSLLRYDSDDYPILGDAGRTILRRLFMKVAYAGACTLYGTARLDFNTFLATRTFVFSAPTRRRILVLELKVARVCSYAGVVLQVAARDGKVEFLGLACAHKPLAPAADTVAGSEVAT